MTPTLCWPPCSPSSTPNTVPQASASSFQRGPMAAKVRKLSGVRWAWPAPVYPGCKCGQPLLTCRKQPSSLSRHRSPLAQNPLESVLKELHGRGCPPTWGFSFSYVCLPPPPARDAQHSDCRCLLRLKSLTLPVSSAQLSQAGIFQRDFAEI